MVYDVNNDTLTLRIAEPTPVEVDMTGGGLKPNVASLTLSFPEGLSDTQASEVVAMLEKSSVEERAEYFLERHIAYLERLEEKGFFDGFFYDTEYKSSDLEKGLHRARLTLFARSGREVEVGSANLWADRLKRERLRCLIVRGLFLGFTSCKADALAEVNAIINRGYDGFEARALRICQDFARQMV